MSCVAGRGTHAANQQRVRLATEQALIISIPSEDEIGEWCHVVNFAKHHGFARRAGPRGAHRDHHPHPHARANSPGTAAAEHRPRLGRAPGRAHRPAAQDGTLASRPWDHGKLYKALAEALVMLGKAHPGGLDELALRR
ncbi:hypothetical protein ABZ897_55555 [Nonomuraea sp. NPDC046802]|uniref:hypothetical protein n=1 Tax=Nonomuraea sp. NPDC046802 TaxID=3154919 RepID=UPI0033D6A94E